MTFKIDKIVEKLTRSKSLTLNIHENNKKLNKTKELNRY